MLFLMHFNLPYCGKVFAGGGQTHSVRQLKEASFPLSLHPFSQVKQKESRLHPETKHAGSGLSAGWMSHADLHSQTHHSNGVIYVDAGTKYIVRVDVLPHKTGLWRCSGGAICIVTQLFIYARKYTSTSNKLASAVKHSAYLACHISSLATRSQDAGWKLFIHGEKKNHFFI